MQQEGRFDYRHLFICSLVSFTAGLVVASFADFRLFLPALLDGAWITIQITAMSCVLAVVFALLAGLAKMSPFWPLRWIAIAYIEVFRGTSALVAAVLAVLRAAALRPHARPDPGRGAGARA